MTYEEFEGFVSCIRGAPDLKEAIRIASNLMVVDREEHKEASQVLNAPSPDTVSLAIIQGLLASGQYSENPTAAIHSAWRYAHEYYLARDEFPAWAGQFGVQVKV